jgi:hypothetical protein
MHRSKASRQSLDHLVGNGQQRRRELKLPLFDLAEAQIWFAVGKGCRQALHLAIFDLSYLRRGGLRLQGQRRKPLSHQSPQTPDTDRSWVHDAARLV